jgi:hypothetical protein
MVESLRCSSRNMARGITMMTSNDTDIGNVFSVCVTLSSWHTPLDRMIWLKLSQNYMFWATSNSTWANRKQNVQQSEKFHSYIPLSFNTSERSSLPISNWKSIGRLSLLHYIRHSKWACTIVSSKSFTIKHPATQMPTDGKRPYMACHVLKYKHLKVANKFPPSLGN